METGDAEIVMPTDGRQGWKFDLLGNEITTFPTPADANCSNIFRGCGNMTFVSIAKSRIMKGVAFQVVVRREVDSWTPALVH